MTFKSLKTLVAAASLAMVLASPAHARNLPCPVDTGLEKCYGGFAFGTGNTFSDWKIGTLNLGSGSWDLLGLFDALGAENLTVALVGATTMSSPEGASFMNVAGGDYIVRLSGMFTAGNPMFTGGQSLALYGGGFDIKSAIPEPQTYALLLAGLLAVGYVARRRKTD